MGITLLTEGISSPKLAKDQRYLTYIMYLASGTYRPELCPNAGDCLKSCLITKAGRGAIGGPDNAVQRARKARTDFLFSDREGFLKQLHKEIDKAIVKARRLGLPLAIRLNGGSDLDWSEVYAKYSVNSSESEPVPVLFWEYTKRPDLALKLTKLTNVHVTYSYSERTTNRILGTMLANKINVAMVFNTRKGHALPDHVGSIPVIDGDTSDLRFLDAKGVVVGLRLKSLRKPNLENNQFVQQVA